MLICFIFNSYAWILQDILGMVFCINMMKTVRLPSFKVTGITNTLSSVSLNYGLSGGGGDLTVVINTCFYVLGLYDTSDLTVLL